MKRMIYSATAACLIATSALAAASTPRIEAGWVRATPPAARAGAAYFNLTNPGKAPDRLLGGSAPGVERVEVHEMSMTDGIMRMRPLTDGLVIPAGGTVALKPGGYHIMLIGLARPLKAGESLPLTLRFEKAGKVTVTLPIKTPPAAGAH
ncbi:copper chaperone PCu(A)C [Caulobacter sp. B11]|uniref:copper chaperone PCu(A)C n=1 Tax=Caulobacter sp. B11 TaxID=2048899 RepID=UPI00191B9D98|nr:copper chaperone PCu(A)C [Caulobacter sp. B11]